MWEYTLGFLLICLIGFYIYKKCSEKDNQDNQDNQNCIKFNQLFPQDIQDQQFISYTPKQHFNGELLPISHPSQISQRSANRQIEFNRPSNPSQISQGSENRQIELKILSNPVIANYKSDFRQMSQVNPTNYQSQLKQTNYTRFQADFGRNQEVQDKINEIYDKSCRQRNVNDSLKYFLGQYFEFSEMCRNYSVTKLMSKQNLKKICAGFRAVRGDGNCFYTAIGFQFLEVILLEYTNDQFYKFLNDNEVPFSIKLNNQYIFDENTQKNLRNEFFYRLERLKLIQNIEIRKQKLFQEFRAYEKVDDEIDGCLYGLATIFFRNLAYKVIEKNEQTYSYFDKDNLLMWEVECNDNELVIQSFANYLKLFIQLLFFSNGDFLSREYGSENNYKILLLIKPGHYSIGIKEK